MVSLITHEDRLSKGARSPEGGSRPAHGVVACPDSRRRGTGTGLRARLGRPPASPSGTGCGSASTCCSTAGVVWDAPGPSQPACWWSWACNRDDAIRRVRDAHEWTIENISQLAHVRQCSAQAPSASIPDRGRHPRPGLGAFLGLAVGDAAIGTTPRILLPRYAAASRRHGWWRCPFDLPAGAWTDDTAMALARVADSLAESKTLDCRDLMDRFVKWWRVRRLLVERRLLRHRKHDLPSAHPVPTDG